MIVVLLHWLGGDIPTGGVFNGSREYLFSVLPCSLLSLYISHLLLLYLETNKYYNNNNLYGTTQNYHFF